MKSEAKELKSAKKDNAYHEGVGRRKRATARVRIYAAAPDKSVEQGNVTVNGMSYQKYFSLTKYKDCAVAPLVKLKLADQFSLTATVSGGGITGQAEAIRMGLSRALLDVDILHKPRLKPEGFLRRDPREKERRKYGLKKARRAPQFSKR